MRKERILLALMLALAVPLAAAQRMPSGVQNVFQTFASVLKNQFAVFFFTFLLFFMLFYAIYAALAARLHFFQDGQTHGTNRLGKIFSVSLALLTSFAIFYFTKGRSIQQTLDDVLGPFGVFAGLVLALVTFLFVWQGFRHDIGNGLAMTIALFAAGLALVAIGAALALPNILGWGYTIAFLALLGGLIGGLIRHEFPGQAAHAAPPGAHGPPPDAGPGPAPPPPGAAPAAAAAAAHAAPGEQPPGQVGWAGPGQPFNNAALLQWMARPEDEHVTHYQIRWWRGPRWATVGRGQMEVGLGNEVPNRPNVRAWLVTGLGNHAYNFQIRAFNRHGPGPWSTVIHATTAEGLGDPGGPAAIPPPIRGRPMLHIDEQGNPVVVVRAN